MLEQLVGTFYFCIRPAAGDRVLQHEHHLCSFSNHVLFQIRCVPCEPFRRYDLLEGLILFLIELWAAIIMFQNNVPERLQVPAGQCCPQLQLSAKM